MPAAQKQIFFRQVWRLHPFITCLQLHLLRQLLQFFNHHRAIRLPQRQARAHLVVEDKDLQLLAQLAVIALLGFLLHVQEMLQLIGLLKRQPIDALQHRVLLVPAPIRTAALVELERRRVNLARVRHMRATAQIRKTVLCVKCDWD